MSRTSGTDNSPRQGALEVRVRWREDGLVELSLPRPGSDGTTSLRFEPLAFIGRLVPLIPPTRRHQVRYDGVLAPNVSWRPEITSHAARGVRRSAPCRPRRTSGQPPAPRPRRLAWAELLKRTFAVDVLRCARSGSRRELLAVAMKSESVAAILTHLRLDTDDAGPRPPPGRSPTQGHERDWEVFRAPGSALS